MLKNGPIYAALLVIGWLLGGVAQAQQTQVATLFGEPVTEADISPNRQQLSDIARAHSISKDMALAIYRHGALADKIVEAVLQDYADKHEIRASDQLVTRFLVRFSADMQVAPDAGKEDHSLREVAETQVQKWLIDKALYAEFGGAVIFQQGNPQLPAGAYEKLLKQYQQQGHFEILQESYQAVFWEAFEPPFSFELPPEQVDFSSPWWLN
ncbi:SurA N-terminal domain-containing protein [Alteromonas sp. ASW11-19]|uniref:SurA N-terminal domain-containing protein n=1 Tax=Alteromonas salexigens TaxID=2982530 RepID=A0ABT2VNN0_9ALTE|nr:SurA N-terminal domain-containing protein [Alteromonas salexigens]MCU7554498.1 SurA N-terminal domain-containing protein [Alteromonas salexigens]